MDEWKAADPEPRIAYTGPNVPDVLLRTYFMAPQGTPMVYGLGDTPDGAIAMFVAVGDDSFILDGDAARNVIERAEAALELVAGEGARAALEDFAGRVREALGKLGEMSPLAAMPVRGRAPN